VIHPHCSCDEGSKAEVDRQRDCPVADEPCPRVDEGEDLAGSRRGELESPVVGASRGWVAGGEFAEGEGDTSAMRTLACVEM